MKGCQFAEGYGRADGGGSGLGVSGFLLMLAATAAAGNGGEQILLEPVRDTTIFSKSLETAPVLRPTILGPLSFAIWGKDDVALPIGEETRVFFLVGNRGSGPDTLSAVSEDFLDPATDRIIATLIARDREGKEVQTRNEIKGHC